MGEGNRLLLVSATVLTMYRRKGGPIKAIKILQDPQ
jgi:hypothetical protein